RHSRRNCPGLRCIAAGWQLPVPRRERLRLLQVRDAGQPKRHARPEPHRDTGLRDRPTLATGPPNDHVQQRRPACAARKSEKPASRPPSAVTPVRRGIPLLSATSIVPPKRSYTTSPTGTQWPPEARPLVLGSGFLLNVEVVHLYRWRPSEQDAVPVPADR